LFWSTSSCVAIGCQHEQDGPTRITLSSIAGPTPAESLIFDAVLNTPSGMVIVETVVCTRLLEQAVPSSQTRVRVWTDGRPWPDALVIGLG
jgi:hypothetical protein